MTTKSGTPILPTIVGITSSTIFFGGNLAVSFMLVPALLLSSPQSPLPAPTNSTNASSPTVTSSPKPVTKASHLARQWQATYDRGAIGGPILALLTAGSWLYTVRRLPAGAKFQQKLLLAASALSLTVLPFTLTVMKRTNGELSRRAKASEDSDEAVVNSQPNGGTVESYQTLDLLQWWSQLNFM